MILLIIINFKINEILNKLKINIIRQYLILITYFSFFKIHFNIYYFKVVLFTLYILYYKLLYKILVIREIFNFVFIVYDLII